MLPYRSPKLAVRREREPQNGGMILNIHGTILIASVSSDSSHQVGAQIRQFAVTASGAVSLDADHHR